MASDYSAITQHNEQQLGLDTASRKTQICMYSDSTHFVYELLQNADDYGATEVVFTLTRNELVVEHNGQPFAEENVKAITYFGKSTSREDLVKAGRFGVGFKSVFAFTATPVILSGDEHLMIHGLYRVSEHPRPEGLSRNRTRIILPFNHVTEKPDYVEDLMPPEDANSKIAERLSGLNMKTLLFTRHIREIRWETEHGFGHYLREDQPRDGARYTTITDGGSLHRYLVFARTPTWHAQQHKAVEIAFALDAKDQITPTDDCLYVLFATTQETHLQFIVNGPYRTNPSRETIAEDDPFNVHLMGETCSLMRDVLPHIRDSALLTTAFLSVLPNPDDKLRPFYKPLLTVVVARFLAENLVPTDNGGHAAAAAVVQGPAAIREVVTAAELPFLAGKSAANWVKGVQPNTRPDVFLRALGIKSWGYDELQAALDKKFGGAYYPPPVAPSDTTWLSQRADAWMQKLYVLLGDAIKKEECSEATLQWCRVIRVMEDRHENHVSGPNAYFPKGRGFRDLPQIKHSIVRGRSTQHAKKIEASLAALGVKEIGDEQRVELILEAYYNNERPSVSAEQHIGHMRSFIKWWKKEESPGRYQSQSIFRTAQGEDYKSGDCCYMDAPLHASGLAAIYRRRRLNIEPKLALWAGYKKLVGEGFCDFAAACGVADRICIEPQSTLQHPRAKDLHRGTGATGRSRYGKDDDYIIPDLAVLLSLKDVGVSVLIWNVMCKADPEVLEARYRPNLNCETNTQKSSLVLEISKAAWIPDRRRVFRKPAEMSKAKLYPDFKYDNRNGWLDEIGFGEAEKLADQAYQKQRESAQALGCPPKIVDLINSCPATERSAMWQRCEEMLRKSVAERKRVRWLEQLPASFREGFKTAFRRPGIHGQQTDGFTGTLAKNPKGRTEKLAAEISAAIHSEPPLEGRFAFQVRKAWKGKNDKVKAALVHWYHGRCQICDWTFTQRNGQPYFEGLYLVPYTHAEWVDRPGNVVCLCPQHSAMFQFGSKEVTGDLVEVVENFTSQTLGGTSEPVLKFTLCGQNVALKFHENHFLELQVMLRQSSRVSGE